MLARSYPAELRSLEIDIRDAQAVSRVFAERAAEIELVIHAAAQPSHDWAASAVGCSYSGPDPIDGHRVKAVLEVVRARAHVERDAGQKAFPEGVSQLA